MRIWTHFDTPRLKPQPVSTQEQNSTSCKDVQTNFKKMPSAPVPRCPGAPVPGAPVPRCPDAPVPRCPSAPVPQCPSARCRTLVTPGDTVKKAPDSLEMSPMPIF